MHDTDRARSALHAINPGCERDEWVRIGMAAKAAGLDVEDFDSWSAGAANYNGERDTRSVWKSFRPGGGIGAGTLFAMAREAGWTDGINGRPTRPQRPRKPAAGSEASSFDFRAVWDASEPATHDHAYIKRKLGLADGLRVYHGDLMVARTRLDGALLVPVYDGDGGLQSWQAVLPDGTKRSAPGAALRGGSFTVGGPIRDDGQIYFVEGIGQAWSAFQATGRPAVCCFGAGSVQTIAEDLHARHPKARIVIVADAGKEEDAERIAVAVGGSWVRMPEDSPANFDLNDYHQQTRSLEAVAELLAQEIVPETGEDPDRPREIDLSALAEQEPEPPAFIVPDWLPAGEVTLFAAHGGTGKSALALRLAVCLATGRDWYGHPVQRRAVDYVSFEDAAPVLHWRLYRTCQAMGVPMTELVGWLRVFDGTHCASAWYARGQYGETGATAAFHDIAERIGGPGRVVFVDGSSDTFAGSENDRAQVKAFIRLLRRLTAIDGALVLIAHVDKLAAAAGANAQGFSGSTGWNNGVRCRWFMFAETDEEGTATGNVIVEVRKSNLGRTGARMVLRFDTDLHVFQRVDTDEPRRTFQRVDESEAVLSVIRAATAADSPIPAATSGTRTAHSVAEAHGTLPESLRGRTGRKRFYRTLEQLRAAGRVRVTAVRRANRHAVEVLCVAE